MPAKKTSRKTRHRTSHAGTKPPTPARLMKLFKEADREIAQRLRLELGIEPSASHSKATKNRSGMRRAAR